MEGKEENEIRKKINKSGKSFNKVNPQFYRPAEVMIY